MAGGEPRLGTTATYMRHNDHGTTRLSTKINILHDRSNNEYRVFSAGSVRVWSKFGLYENGSGIEKDEAKKASGSGWIGPRRCVGSSAALITATRSHTGGSPNSTRSAAIS